MKILIDIPTENLGVEIIDKFQDFFKRLQVETKEHLISNTSLVCGCFELETIEMFLNAFEEMQIIPDDATNGDMIKAVFPNVEIYTNVINEIIDVEIFQDSSELRCSVNWWNAPYKRGNENGTTNN